MKKKLIVNMQSLIVTFRWHQFMLPEAYFCLPCHVLIYLSVCLCMLKAKKGHKFSTKNITTVTKCSSGTHYVQLHSCRINILSSRLSWTFLLISWISIFFQTKSVSFRIINLYNTKCSFNLHHSTIVAHYNVFFILMACTKSIY